MMPLGAQNPNYPTSIAGLDDPATPDSVTITSMTREMVAEVRQIHAEAFAGYMNTRLGKSYMEAFLNWFLTADGALALAALDHERKVLGYVLGAPLDYGKAMNCDLLRVAAISILLRPWLFFSGRFWRIVEGRIRSTLNLLSTNPTRFRPPEPAMGLIAIGVASSVRGKKVGLRLLRAFEVRARELGIRSLLLTVYPNNFTARKLYESCHWTPLLAQEVENKAVKYVRILDDDPSQ